MSFSFNLDNSQVNASTTKYFKPYTINKINKISIDKKDGKKKDGGDWLALNVTYTGEEGSVSKMYFYDNNDKDGITRGEYNGQPCFPSSYEIIKQLAIHVLGNYNESAFEKFKKYVTKVKTMEQFIDGFIKLVNEAPENDSLYIKVIGRKSQGRIYSDIPSPCAVSKIDDKYTHTDENGNTVGNDVYVINFLSSNENNLTFTPNEVKKQMEYANAKPTNMDEKVDSDSILSGDNDDDLENLDLSGL